MSMTPETGGTELDQERFQALTQDLHGAIMRHYIGAPLARARAFEALNALAVVAASILAGAGEERDDVRAWFDRAIDESIANVERIKQLVDSLKRTAS